MQIKENDTTMSNKVYGYARISTKKQSIQRQLDNIQAYNECAIIFKEEFTGTKVEGRKEFNKLLKKVKEGDTIIFDSVSRMSRNAQEGFELYKELLNKGVDLIFLKEMHINTTTFKMALGNKIELVGNQIADKYIQATNEVIELIAEQQIKIAFDQAQKEVTDLQQRTKEGLRVAKVINGVVLGRQEGTKVTTRKSIQAKKRIQELSKDFGGTNTDKDIIAILGITRNTYYKYKKELIWFIRSDAA